MPEETLEDHLRKATRHFTSPLPEDQALALGRDLLREVARAHSEAPPRFPEIEPKSIALVDGRPRLDGGGGPDVASTVFEIGALLHSLLATAPPEVSWWLDGPPPAELGTLARSAALRGLVSSSPDARFPSAAAAAEALDAALRSAPASPVGLDDIPRRPGANRRAAGSRTRAGSLRSGTSRWARSSPRPFSRPPGSWPPPRTAGSSGSIARRAVASSRRRSRARSSPLPRSRETGSTWGRTTGSFSPWKRRRDATCGGSASVRSSAPHPS